MAARRATHNDPPPGFQRLETPTHIPFLPAEGFPPLLMATQDDPVGTVVVHHEPVQATLVKTRQTRCGHGIPPHLPRQEPPLAPGQGPYTACTLPPYSPCERGTGGWHGPRLSCGPLLRRSKGAAGAGARVEPARDFAPLPLHCVEQMQGRYELSRPLVLLDAGPASQRAPDTPTPPDTVRTFVRRFRQQGMWGL